jgi:hypothetical protein
MSTAARLVGFAGLLALVFAVAAFAGDRVDWTPRTDAAADDHADGMANDKMAPERGAEGAPGLAVSDGGLTLALDRTSFAAGRTAPLRFRIVDEHAKTVRNFDVEHAKRMHVIVVRRDLSGFRHLHPTQERDGSWSVPLKLPEAGTYRVFADFTTDGERHTLGADLAVDGEVQAHPLPAPATTTTVDGYRVTLNARGDDLRFSVTRGGKPVDVEPYLGARGHLVALRQGDLAYLHVHPDAHSLSFMAEFPSAGRYRLFLQFQHEGRVHTAELTDVERPEADRSAQDAGPDAPRR